MTEPILEALGAILCRTPTEPRIITATRDLWISVITRRDTEELRYDVEGFQWGTGWDRARIGAWIDQYVVPILPDARERFDASDWHDE